MSLFDMVPKVVEIQHTCHCDTAVERPHDGHSDVHKFTVDGAEFPWYISEQGQKVSRIHDDLYVIEVDIMLLDKETRDFLSFTYDNGEGSFGPPMWPIINGAKFPWLLHEDGCVLRFSSKIIPTLNLKFFALQVITNIDITDERDDNVYCAGGGLIASSMFSDHE